MPTDLIVHEFPVNAGLSSNGLASATENIFPIFTGMSANGLVQNLEQYLPIFTGMSANALIPNIEHYLPIDIGKTFYNIYALNNITTSKEGDAITFLVETGLVPDGTILYYSVLSKTTAPVNTIPAYTIPMVYNAVGAEYATVLYLNAETTEDLIALTDKSLYKYPVVSNNGLTVSNLIYKNGTGSLKINGTSTNNPYIAHDVNLDLHDADKWTIELYVYMENYTTTCAFMMSKDGVANVSYPQYRVKIYDLGIDVVLGSGNGVLSIQTFSSTWITSIKFTWVHFAIVKNGNILRIFKDGINLQTTTITCTMVSGNKPLYLGSESGQSATSDCWIDELRIIKGVAKYSVNFDPSNVYTQNQLNQNIIDVSTILYVKGDGTNNSTSIIDSSTISPKTLTNAGGVKISTDQSKLGGSSIYFNTSYLTSLGNIDFTLGSGNFTVELYFNTAKLNTVLLDYYSGGSNGWQVYINASGIIQWWNGSLILSSVLAILINVWTHLAIVRYNNIITIYINGKKDTSVANTTNINYVTSTFAIGTQYASRQPTYDYLGYMDEIRVLKGVSKYIADFIPGSVYESITIPSQHFNELFVDDVTILHLKGEGVNGSTTFIDSGINPKTITVVGNIKTSIAYSKLGNSSIYFNGTIGSRLDVTPTDDFILGTKDFTIEGWYYTLPAISDGVMFTIGQYGNGNTGTGLYGEIYKSGATLSVVLGGLYGSGAQHLIKYDTNELMLINKWVHIAYVRCNSIINLFINGKVCGAPYKTIIDFTLPSRVRIGSLNHWSGIDNFSYNYTYNGYIDDFKIIKGIAKYNSNFEPSLFIDTTNSVNENDFGEQTNLVFHLKGDGSNNSNIIVDSSPTPKTLTTVGIAVNSTITRMMGTGSIYLNNSTATRAYITTPASTDFAFGTDDFTIEFWANKTVNSYSGADYVMSTATNNYGDGGWYINFTAGAFGLSHNRIAIISYAITTGSDGLWHHYSIVRNDGTFIIFVDGISLASVTTAVNITANDLLKIGVLYTPNATSSYFNGYIDDLKIYKGLAKYTSTFSPGGITGTVVINDDKGTFQLIPIQDSLPEDPENLIISLYKQNTSVPLVTLPAILISDV